MELKPPDQLRNSGNWFQYWQLLDIYKEVKKNFGFLLKLTDLETCLTEIPNKQISKIYKILLQWYTQDENVKEYMIKWALNFNTETELETWEYLWRKSMQISTCTAIKENTFKMMARWYITPHPKISKN